MTFRRISALLTLLLFVGLVFAPTLTSHANAAQPSEAGFQLLPYCNPSLFPTQGTAEFSDIGSPDGSEGVPCGFSAFQQLIVNIIKWLLYIIVPIAFVIVGWAGFKIMTSAGSGEAIQQAYGMIKIVVVGVLIAALSYIIIVNVFNVLNVKIQEQVLK